MPTVKNQSSRVGLTPFSPQDDMPMIERWLKFPHVARWWGDPKEAIEEVRKHDNLSSALILVDGTPIGYLCWQIPSHQELADARLDDLPANLVDIDIVIGEPSALGQGFGPEALTQLLTILRDKDVQVVGMATAESNKRARKAYDKVGFQLFRSFTESGQQMRYLIKVLSPNT